MSELQTISLTDYRQSRERDWRDDYDSAFSERPAHPMPALGSETDVFLGDFLTRLASNLSVTEVQLKEAIEATASELAAGMAGATR